MDATPTDARSSFPDAISIDFRGDDGVARYYQDPGGDSVYEAVLPATERTWFTRDGGGYRRHFPGGAYETYDSAGRLATVVDVAGNTTVLSRDASGRLLGVTDAGGRSLVLAYDDGRADRQPLRRRRDRGLVRVRQYGANNLLETVRYPDGSGYAFAADGSGQILRVSDAAGRPIESHAYGSTYAGYGLTSELADGREKLTLAYDPFSTVVTDGERERDDLPLGLDRRPEASDEDRGAVPLLRRRAGHEGVGVRRRRPDRLALEGRAAAEHLHPRLRRLRRVGRRTRSVARRATPTTPRAAS